MALPKYAQGADKTRLFKIHCRGKCQKGRYAEVVINHSNQGGTIPTSDSFAKCLMCGGLACDPSNWQKPYKAIKNRPQKAWAGLAIACLLWRHYTYKEMW